MRCALRPAQTRLSKGSTASKPHQGTVDCAQEGMDGVAVIPRPKAEGPLPLPKVLATLGMTTVSATPSIEVKHLRKLYGEIVAVDDLTFTVPRGAVLGLLGGNGAGKTTTIAMLLGLLEPTAGDIHVLGIDMKRRRYAALPR